MTSTRDTGTLPDISDRSHWRLSLTVGDSCVRAIFRDDAAHRVVCYSSRTWQGDPAESLSKIVDAIYEDPVILDDYTTTILVRPTRMLFVPATTPADDIEANAAELISLVDAADNKDVWTEPLLPGVLAVWSTPAEVRDFLLRTFPTEDVHIALLPLVRLMADTRGEVAIVHLDNTTLDIVVMRDGVPLLINTREYGEPADAAYYIVYALQAIGVSTATAEVRVSGRREVRAQLMPMLRRHLGFVTNALLPTPVKNAVAEGVSLVEAL